MPDTVVPAREPARLFQRMLLNSRGLLKAGALVGSDAWSCWLFSEVETPAGAGSPLEVTAVAVVMLSMIVLLKIRTSGASLMPMPPPSWVEMLLVMTLL